MQASQTYFRLSAILILECSEAGALGVILNRPTEHALRDVQFSSDQPMENFLDNRLWMGGDVGDGTVIVLTHSDQVADTTQVAAGIRVCTVTAAAAAVESGKAKPSDFRLVRPALRRA